MAGMTTAALSPGKHGGLEARRPTRRASRRSSSRQPGGGGRSRGALNFVDRSGRRSRQRARRAPAGPDDHVHRRQSGRPRDPEKAGGAGTGQMVDQARDSSRSGGKELHPPSTRGPQPRTRGGRRRDLRGLRLPGAEVLVPAPGRSSHDAGARDALVESRRERQSPEARPAMGDPRDARTSGSRRQRAPAQEILRVRRDRKGEGKVVAGGEPGRRTGGSSSRPTVIDEVPRDARIAREEIFGPVLAGS